MLSEMSHMARSLRRKLGMKGMVLRSAGGLGVFAGRNGITVLLHQPEMEGEQGQEESRQHDHVQSKETLHGEIR